MDMRVKDKFVYPAHKMTEKTFKSPGEVDRSFTILVHLAVTKDGGTDYAQNGIAIIDNDSTEIILEGAFPQGSATAGVSTRQNEAFEAINGMDWAEFGNYLRSSPHVVSLPADIQSRQAQPDAGNFISQVKLGLRKPEDRDLRDDFIRGIHANGDYRLPRMSRTGMINEIMTHPTSPARSGRTLSWDIRMNFRWDETGRIEGGEEIDSQFDQRWQREVSVNEGIFRRATETALAPYLVSDFSVLDLDDAGCELDTDGANHGFLVMRSFRGASMAFETPTEFNTKLRSLPDSDLLALWATVRVLDQDLSRKSRTHEMRMVYNDIRAEMEAEWVVGLEEELELGM